jgi:tetratricopeptide (TPR) repeat protein
LRIQVLGPLRGWRDGVEVDLGPTAQRAALGLLVLAGGQPVSVAELVDGLWPQRPPSTATNVVQTHVRRLRLLLDVGRRPYRPSEVLPTIGGGYALRTQADDVDLARFRRLVGLAEQARARGELPAAAALFGQALRLWQGAPLAGITVLASHPRVVALLGERHVAVAHYAEAMIAAGAAADALPVLTEAAAGQPLDEAAQARLIRALHAAGQRAQAFYHYHHTRRRLAEELGVDPGPQLAAAHATLLSAAGDPAAGPGGAGGGNGRDPAPARPRPAAGPGGPAPSLLAAAQVAAAARPPLPAQLPAEVGGFTGRAAELAELGRVLGVGEAPSPAALPICVVSGGAGVGKTALAVRWAHRSRARFPDGQLYVDLRGYDPDQPVAAADALVGFLTALGVPAQDVPLDLDDRAARFRTEVADRRILVLLDNASSVEQVRRLLPGTRSAVVLVTSRDSLPGLVAVHGAHRLEVGLLPAGDAVLLLGRLAGDRVAAHPQAAAALAARCANLPLALRVAAELAVARPATPLAELVAELGDEQRRLDLLDAGGDPRAAVRAVFSWSVRNLPAAADRTFRLLGLHPGPDIDPYATAALAGTTLGQARRALDGLVRAHLVQPAGGDRYGMHDLLRAYAAGLAGTHETGEQRRAARTRLFDHYLAAAAAAMAAWNPAEASRRPGVAAAGPMPELGTGRQALAWLDAERATLGAVCGYTAAHGWPAHAVALSGTLFRYLEAGGHHVEALAVHGHARAAARQAGDRGGEASALIDLGTTYWRQGRYQPAADHLQQALDLARETGDPAAQARALNSLGIVDWRRGRYRPAAQRLQQALELARQTGDRAGQASALTNLANVYGSQGRYGPAAASHQEALDLARQTDDQIGQARALSNLGHIHVRQGRLDQAAEHHLRALDLFRQVGDRDAEAYALTGLGDICVRQGRLEQAAEHHLRALDLFRQAGDRGSEAEPLNGLGQTALAAGDPGQARDLHTAALTIATDTGDQYQLARAHDGLAHAHRDLGDTAGARDHWRRALALYTDLATPEAGAVRAALAALDPAAASG